MGHGDRTTWDVGCGGQATLEGSWGCGPWAVEAGRCDRWVVSPGVSKGGQACGRVAGHIEGQPGVWEGGQVCQRAAGWPGHMGRLQGCGPWAWEARRCVSRVVAAGRMGHWPWGPGNVGDAA